MNALEETGEGLAPVHEIILVGGQRTRIGIVIVVAAIGVAVVPEIGDVKIVAETVVGLVTETGIAEVDQTRITVRTTRIKTSRMVLVTLW